MFSQFANLNPGVAAIVYLAGVLLPLLVFSARFRTGPTARGAASWMTLWQAVRLRLFSPFPKGLLVGDWKRWMILPLYYGGASNILTVGNPGSMKGVGMLIPNALRWPFQFIFDPGGEITAVCIKEWRRQGYNVYVLNAWDMHSADPWKLPSHSFNPLDFLDPASRTFASDADWLADMLLVRTGKEHDQFFNDSAQAGIKALLMHNKTHEPPARQNLLVIREYLLLPTGMWTQLLNDMLRNKADPLIGRQAIEWQRMSQAAGKTLQAILSSMVRATNFLEDQVIRDGMCASDVRMEDLKGEGADGKPLKGTIVSVIVPLRSLETHAPYVRLAICCGLLTMQRGKRTKSRVLFMLDEFPSLGKMDRVVNGLTTLRKYGVWLHLVIQTIAQIKDIYGPGWNKIEGGCELRQYITAWDQETAKHVSDMCGTATVEHNGSHISRNLAMPEEVRQTRKSEQIVFFGNSPPARLSIRPYWERPSLSGKYHDNPFHGRTPSLPVTWPVQVALGAVTWIIGWVLTPSLSFVALAGLVGWVVLR